MSFATNDDGNPVAATWPDHENNAVTIEVGGHDPFTVPPEEARQLADQYEEEFADEVADPEYDLDVFVADLRRVANEADPQASPLDN